MAAEEVEQLICAEAQNILDQWNIHPKYTTSYEVNRTRRTWQQGLGLRRNVGILKLNDRFSLTRVNNTAQNDYQLQRASNRLALDTELGGWTAGVDFSLRRDRSENNFSLRKDHNTDIGLRLEKDFDLPLQFVNFRD